MEKEERENTFFMRGAEAKALLYEVPVFLVGLVGGAAMAVFYAYAVRRFDPGLETRMPLFLMAALVGFGLILVFWAASYFPRSVTVMDDRLVFNMLFGERSVRLADIESIEALEPEAARRSLLSPVYLSLTATIGDAIMLKRKKGLVWVFSPIDSEGFLAAAAEMTGGPGRESDDADPQGDAPADREGG